MSLRSSFALFVLSVSLGSSLSALALSPLPPLLFLSSLLIHLTAPALVALVVAASLW